MFQIFSWTQFERSQSGRENTYVSIELSNETGEIVVFEISRKKNSSEFWRIPNDEAVTSRSPWYDVISLRIIHHLICLRQERRRTSTAAGRHRRWNHIHFIELREIRRRRTTNELLKAKGFSRPNLTSKFCTPLWVFTYPGSGSEPFIRILDQYDIFDIRVLN